MFASVPQIMKQWREINNILCHKEFDLDEEEDIDIFDIKVHLRYQHFLMSIKALSYGVRCSKY